jgi:hypothetical protein
MALEIRNYVAQCDICQRMKIRRHKLYNLFQPFSRPITKWKNILIDFITGLPPSLHKGIVYDVILVMVDRCSAIIHFIFCTKDVNSKDLVDYIYDEVVKHYNMPASIVIDKGSVFISK